jgi:hypothetical protein
MEIGNCEGNGHKKNYAKSQGRNVNGSVQVAMEMRAAALEAVCRSSEGARTLMACLTADLKGMLQERVVAPWTRVARVEWDRGPPELLAFLVEKERVLEDRVR